MVQEVKTDKEKLVKAEFWSMQAMSCYDVGSSQHDILRQAHELIRQANVNYETSARERALRAAQII